MPPVLRQQCPRTPLQLQCALSLHLPLLHPPPAHHPHPLPPAASWLQTCNPWTCYNCNKPGHITWNCPEPHAHQVRNTDPLSLETIQAIVEAVRIAVGGDATRGEEVTGNIEPARSEAKELQDF